MPTHAHLRAAAELGLLAGERDVTAAAGEALRLVESVVRGDAASLVTRDLLDGRHRAVAEDAYPQAVAASLAVDFAGTPWFDLVVRDPLPLSISTERPQTFREGWFYAEHMLPAGFRDGMTGALRRGGRYVGLVHVSTAAEGAFDGAARRLLATLLAPLAVLADRSGHPVEDTELPSGGDAALVTGGCVVALPGRRPPAMLDDPALLAVVAEFGTSAGDRLRLWWPAQGHWHRVTLHRGTGRRGSVVVHAEPADLPYDLSARELDVLTRLVLGMSNEAVARSLVVSPRTVHTHVERVLRKTGTASRTEAATLALRCGLVRPVAGLPGQVGTAGLTAA